MRYGFAKGLGLQNQSKRIIHSFSLKQMTYRVMGISAGIALVFSRSILLVPEFAVGKVNRHLPFT